MSIGRPVAATACQQVASQPWWDKGWGQGPTFLADGPGSVAHACPAQAGTKRRHMRLQVFGPARVEWVHPHQRSSTECLKMLPCGHVRWAGHLQSSASFHRHLRSRLSAAADHLGGRCLPHKIMGQGVRPLMQHCQLQIAAQLLCHTTSVCSHRRLQFSTLTWHVVDI